MTRDIKKRRKHMSILKAMVGNTYRTVDEKLDVDGPYVIDRNMPVTIVEYIDSTYEFMLSVVNAGNASSLCISCEYFSNLEADGYLELYRDRYDGLRDQVLKLIDGSGLSLVAIESYIAAYKDFNINASVNVIDAIQLLRYMNMSSTAPVAGYKDEMN